VNNVTLQIWGDLDRLACRLFYSPTSSFNRAREVDQVEAVQELLLRAVRHESRQDSLNNQFLQANGSVSAEKLALPAFEVGRDVTQISISSAKIYAVSHDGSDRNSTEKAKWKASLRWRGPRPCRWHLTCPALRGNPCGSYSLMYKGNDDEGPQAVCQTSVMHGGLLGGQQELIVALLELVGVAANSAECLFWCTDDGSPPGGQGESSEEDRRLLDRLVSKRAPVVVTCASASRR